MNHKLIKKMAILACMAAAMLMMFTACGKSGDAKEFSNTDGTFSIQAPADFISQDSGSADVISLKAPEGADLGVMVQRMAKNSEAAEGVENLEGLTELYHQRISGMLQQSQKGIQKEPVPDGKSGAALSSAAESFEVSNGMGETGKVFLIYLETQDNYYVISVSGMDKDFDSRIEEVKQGAAELREQ